MKQPRLANSEVWGIGLFVAAHASWAVMHLLTKQLADSYSVFQIAALRGALSVPWILLASVLLTRGLHACVPACWWLQIFRGIALLVTVSCSAFALRRLPLADAYALTFLAPFFILILARAVLGEVLHRNQWLAISIAFGGSLVVLQPSGLSVAALAGTAMMLAAFSYAASAVMLRKLTATDSPIAILLWLNIVLAVGSLVVGGLFGSFHPIANGHWFWFCAIALFGLLGQALATAAVVRARVSIVALNRPGIRGGSNS